MTINNGRLDKRVAIVAVVTAAIVLLAGFAVTSVYARDHFTSDFESSGIPLCSTEEVIFSGTQHFDVEDKDGRQTIHVHWSNVKGEGIETGTTYTIHQNEKVSAILNENGDTTVSTTLHSSMVSSGPGPNTRVEIKLITVVHPNGDIDVIVDDIKVKCPGS